MGSVTPLFCKHSRIAGNRRGPASDVAFGVPGTALRVDERAAVEVAEPPADEVAEALVAAVAAAFVEVPDEPPHAVKARHASARAMKAPIASLHVRV